MPFDIALSRTISYKYDGEHLDWDEVERVVPLLQAAIEEARRGSPDSPVYAFLERVLSSSTAAEEITLSEDPKIFSNLDGYQKKIAQMWLDQKDVDLQQLIEENASSAFGVRCIGYYALMGKLDNASLLLAAKLTLNQEQYDLASNLYQQLDVNSELAIPDLVWYSQAVYNACPDLQGAANALEINERARAIARKMVTEQPGDLEARKKYSYTTQQVAEMLEWTWRISRQKDDLDKAIKEYREAIRLIEEMRMKGIEVPLGRYAQDLLCYTMFLRIAEEDRDRPDLEKNFQKVLALKAGADENYVSASNLRWYQIFILADMGKDEEVQKRATIAIYEDLKTASERKSSQVGRRQYTKLRRFLGQYFLLLAEYNFDCTCITAFKFCQPGISIKTDETRSSVFVLLDQIRQAVGYDIRWWSPCLDLFQGGHSRQHQGCWTSDCLSAGNICLHSVAHDQGLFFLRTQLFQGQLHQERERLAGDNRLDARGRHNDRIPRTCTWDLATRGGKGLVGVGGIKGNTSPYQVGGFTHLLESDFRIDPHDDRLRRWRIFHGNDLVTIFFQRFTNAIAADHKDPGAPRKFQ